MRHMNNSQGAIKRARYERKNASIAEERLWQRLRGRNTGHKFRRQFPVENYILDFYCAGARLCVEVDGDIHDLRRDKDWERDGVLLAPGIRTIRFTSTECLEELDRVIAEIVAECESQIAAGCRPHKRALRFPTV